MRPRVIGRFTLLLTSVLATGIFARLMTQRFTNPFPPLSETLASSLNRLGDLGGVALGFRRLTADLAWIETLQYYGSHEEGQSDYEEDNGRGRYPLFLPYCLRTARLDPSFTYIYYYGAGALGWNLNRPNEAEILLRQGIRSNPQEWRLQQYLAAIAFQKEHDPARIVSFLESFLYDPGCPNLLRNILVHIYTKQRNYKGAFRVLEVIRDSGDPAYIDTANREIDDLHAKMRP